MPTPPLLLAALLAGASTVALPAPTPCHSTGGSPGLAARPQEDAVTKPGFDHAHAAWGALLGKFVNESGAVDYRGLARERAALDAYIAALEVVKPETFETWSRAEQEAFWINAYNAYTIRLILDSYPVSSIRKLGGLFSSVFDKRFIPLQDLARTLPAAKVNGKKDLSLGELEHGVLGRTARTPLFHFAIVCASRSCPKLQRTAWTAETLDEALADAAREFLADATKNDVSIERGALRVSKIFDWSEDELATHPGGIRGLLKAFAPEAVATDAELAEVKLRYRDYDWSLNEWEREPR